MGITVGAKTHFTKTGGEISDTWFGTSTWVMGGVTYDDRRSLRITIVTDEYGANKISISGLIKGQQFDSSSRLDVTDSPTSYDHGQGTGGVELNDDGTGSINVALSPNSTYYVWLFPVSWSDRFWDQNIQVTATGTYGTPGTPTTSGGTFGNAIPITITGGSAGASYTVTTSLAGISETLQTNSALTDLTWTPSIAQYAPAITDSGSGTAVITCQTYYSGVLIGTTTSNTVISFADSSIPPAVSSGWVSHAYYNTGSAASSIAAYVQGYSKAQFTFDSSKITCQYGATITGYKFKYKENVGTTSPYITDTIVETQANIECSVIDSRGQTTTQTITIDLNAYSVPVLSSSRIYRSNSSGSADEDGNCISAIATVKISPINNLNSYSLHVFTKTPTGSYTDRGTMTSGTLKTLTGLSADSTYDVKLELTDALGNITTFTQRIATRTWAMKFRPTGNGVAFGKAAEYDNTLELNNGWTLTLRDVNGNRSALDYAQLVRLLALEAPISFTITLETNNWSNLTQTISNASFVANGYSYFVSPSSNSREDYIDDGVYADDVATNGQITFHCTYVPSTALTVNVVRMVSE